MLNLESSFPQRGDMPITYQQTADKEIHDRVRRKHGAIINELKNLNFAEYYFFGEIPVLQMELV